MKIEIRTNKKTYNFDKTNDCRREIHKRISVYSGALIPLIIRAFNSSEEVLKSVYIDKSNIL